MTDAERARLRGSVARHMAMKPAGSGIAMPLWFVTAGRRTLAGVLAIILVMGSTGGLTFASQGSLPTQPLYPVKLATEEVVALTKSTPQARATYEIKRVEKRFAEVATLAQAGVSISPEESKKITRKIHTHVARVNEETREIKETSLVSAIETQTELATSIEAHRDALTAVAEAQPESVETIAPVLAVAEKELTASETATEIAIVSSVESAAQASTQTDLVSEITNQANEAAARIASLRTEIEFASPTQKEEVPASMVHNRPVAAPAPIEDAQNVDMTVKVDTQEKTETASPALMATTNEIASTPSETLSIVNEQPQDPVVQAPTVIEAPVQEDTQLKFVLELETLLAQARTFIATGNYAEAMAVLQSIDQKITLQSKLQTVETILQVEVPTSVIEVPIQTDGQAKGEIEANAAEDERTVSAASISDSSGPSQR